MNDLTPENIAAELERINAEEAKEESTTEQKVERPHRFPTWGDLLAILGLFLIGQIITRVIFFALGYSFPTTEELTSESVSIARSAEYAMGWSIFVWSLIAQPLVLVMVLIYRAFRGGKWGIVQRSMRGFDPTILLWGILMLISIVVVMEPLQDMLPPMTPPTGRGTYMILALLVVAPIFEELLCRGVILESLRRKRGAWAACIISSFIFGVMHIELQSVLNAFIIGLLLGFLYLRTRSIFAPMLLHSINNLFAYLLLLFGLNNSSLTDFIGVGTLYYAIYGSAIAILLLSAIAISRHITRLDRADREAKRAAAERAGK